MFSRLLVANRGEIAVRVIRACRELGIETVAVYSEADRNALHVQAADRAVLIGGSPRREQLSAHRARHSGRTRLRRPRRASRLWVPFRECRLRAGVRGRRADLRRTSSRRDRADGIEDRCPPADAEARRAGGAGVAPEEQSDESLLSAVESVGYPALVKPSAGGGGIGMRIVRTAADAAAALHGARREAAAAFGDATLYVERLVERPRHIEIQVIADDHGNVVHLFERECSLQRRHQKVIEESPSPALTPVLRARMGEAAVAAARAAGYRNAGTIEFLVEGAGDDAQFYFLEMNTRLQVEHPVTEAVTGLDLVHAQLRVAAGEPLGWTQASLTQRGHAIECRVYAEDPAQGFLPQAGPLLLYRRAARARGASRQRCDGGRRGFRSITTRCWPRSSCRRRRAPGR